MYANASDVVYDIPSEHVFGTSHVFLEPEPEPEPDPEPEPEPSTFIQLKNDINGVIGDYFGYSVSFSSDGSRVAIGAPNSSVSGNLSGYVAIYDLSGTAWIQVGSSISHATADDRFGYSISLSSDGSRVAIGAPFSDVSGHDSGYVAIYDLSGNAWVQIGSTLIGATIGDRFGYSISLSSDGSRVAIGVPYSDTSGDDSGHVEIYDLSGNIWVQKGNDIIGTTDDRLGQSIALSSDGSRVAIGAPYGGVSSNQLGYAAIYDLSGNTWVQIGINIIGKAVHDRFGSSIALSSDGSRVAISAPYNDDGGNASGHVRVYDISNGSWNQIGEDINGKANKEVAGRSISLSSDGSCLAVGATKGEGCVRVYTYKETSWVQLGTDIKGQVSGDSSGFSVSLSSDCSRVAIGAPYNNSGGSYAGHVRIYQYDS